MELLYVIWTLAALATILNTVLLIVLAVVIAKTINPVPEEEPKKIVEQAGLMDVNGRHYPYHLPRP